MVDCGMGAFVADWMSELLGRRVSPQRGWDYLRGMRYRLRVPRPEHEKADLIEQQEWKKKLASVVEQVQKEHAIADVEVWAMDEQRLGLKPVLRDVWVARWGATDCSGELAFPVAFALWFCSPRVWRNKKSGFYPKSISTCSIVC